MFTVTQVEMAPTEPQVRWAVQVPKGGMLFAIGTAMILQQVADRETAVQAELPAQEALTDKTAAL